jgi:phosphopantetheinyl transferase
MDVERLTPPDGFEHVMVFTTPVRSFEVSDVPLADANEVATFATEKRKHEHLTGRWLLGLALHGWGLEDLSSIEVQRTSQRAPFLARIQGAWRRTPLPCISIGHSSGRAFVAVSPPGHAVGIDAEPLKRTLASNAFDMMAKGEELEYLRGRPDEAMRLWTGKESVQKAMGMGMHLNPREIKIPIESRLSNISIGNSKIQLAYWSEKEYHVSLAATLAVPLEPTAEDHLLKETLAAMEDNPTWGVGCKTQRSGA